MKVITTVKELRSTIAALRSPGKSIGFVPTMGFLHEGHLSLIRQASSENSLVVVSIFVNPIQFGPQEDFASYPRNLEQDCRLAKAAGAQIIFAPAVEEMYPQPILTFVDVKNLGNPLCGQSRPGHFRGVCTVVNKLLNIVQPDKAYFGEKDAQQLAIIQQMVYDLNIPVEIIPVPIQREESGLAMSSRNTYLTPEERASAAVLYQSLQKAKELFESGERSSGIIKDTMTGIIRSVPHACIDYIEISDPYSLTPLAQIDRSALIALAVRFGKTRLIDNLTLAEEE